MVDIKYKRRPHWLKIKLSGGANFKVVNKLVQEQNLHTVCTSAKCPNLSECWSQKTATFMILGDICTRNCGFCAVKSGNPVAPDPLEPQRIRMAISELELSYVVITSVTRDDLSDGGARHFTKTINEIKKHLPDCLIEVLVPDFQGNQKAIDLVIESEPNVFNHNLETVKRLYPAVRPQANYQQSLNVLKYAKNKGLKTKSGLMLGLGETRNELLETLENLVNVQCNFLTMGQYLQPSGDHLQVSRFVHPDEFKEYKSIALKMGFDHVESAPRVRSSYHAKEQYQKE